MCLISQISVHNLWHVWHVCVLMVTKDTKLLQADSKVSSLHGCANLSESSLIWVYAHKSLKLKIRHLQNKARFLVEILINSNLAWRFHVSLKRLEVVMIFFRYSKSLMVVWNSGVKIPSRGWLFGIKRLGEWCLTVIPSDGAFNLKPDNHYVFFFLHTFLSTNAFTLTFALFYMYHWI